MKKRPQREVNYRVGAPNYRCGVCPDFRLPTRCRVVEGVIDPDGVCDAFTPPIIGGTVEE